MSDDLNKNAEFSGKHQDEENPVLVAQRYLNIFRQIHIFNKKRQDEFDDSLLKMPSDIRILLSTLPGGSLLLEHLSELEEKRGIIPDELLNSKINETKNATQDEKTVSALRLSSKGAESAALPNHLLKILQQSEEKHAQDLQALTNAFLQSQENMTALLEQALHLKAPASVHVQPARPAVQRVQPAPIHTQSSGPSAQRERPAAQAQQSVPVQKPQSKSEPIPAQEDSFAPDAASKILNFTKKLFTQHKPEDDINQTVQNVSFNNQTPQASISGVDRTPVSLDDIESAPVSLDVDNSLTYPQNTIEEQAGNGADWEWEYVDGDENTSSNGEEWEYIDDTDAAAAQNEQWSYDDAQEGTYTYEYPATDTDEQWEYVEDTNLPNDGTNQNFDPSGRAK
jgi:hypothetical protein